MSLYYITGVTGSGKSTIREALARLGYETHDVDENGIASFYNKVTGVAVDRPTAITERTKEWYAEHEWRMSPQAIERLLAAAQDKPVFLCGIASNNDEFSDAFARIFCLTLDWETLAHRILNRTNNEFGKAPDELASIRGWHEYFENKNRANGAVMIDASQPIELIVKTILDEVGEPIQPRYEHQVR